MQVSINNELQEITEGIHLDELLNMKNLFEMKGIAVAVNMEVVSRQQWKETMLKDKDSILVVKATQGG